MTEKCFKFRIHNTEFPFFMRQEMNAIEELIGKFVVVKTRNCFDGIYMKIWVVRLPKD